MHRLISTFVLVTALVPPAGAQMDHAKSTVRHDSTSAMAASCPLHLQTLSLTPAQTLVVDSIRAAHQAMMMKLMPMHDSMMANHASMMPGNAAMKLTPADSAAMERNMAASIAAVRAILTDAQRVIFDGAVVKHEAEMKAAMKRGDYDCMACCMECMKQDGTMQPMKAKKPDA